jgi:hypothetical protein
MISFKLSYLKTGNRQCLAVLLSGDLLAPVF